MAQPMNLTQLACYMFVVYSIHGGSFDHDLLREFMIFEILRKRILFALRFCAALDARCKEYYILRLNCDTVFRTVFNKYIH